MNSEPSSVQRCAVISGSSRGIGKAIASQLARDGFNIVLNCSSPAGLDETAALGTLLQDTYKVQCIASVANVAQSPEACALIQKAFDTFGRIDVMVNNAGITRDGLLVRMKEQDFDAVIAVNLKGTFNCSKAVATPMIKQRYGRIINLSSVVGISGNAGQVNYAASKAGVIGLTKSLARELASRNITVNAIAPGFIETDMTDALSEMQREAITSRIATGRLGAPHEVAALAGFLASEQAAYITGQVISVDGGMAL